MVAGATGQTTSLLRPPYASSNSALDTAEWAALRNAASDGYLTVLTTLDSEDWRRPGVNQVVANAAPRGSGGQVLLMHDAGGDRAQTVAALGRLLPQLTKRGFTFATVHDVVEMASPMHRASVTSAGMGLALIAARRFIDWLMTDLLFTGACGGVLRNGNFRRGVLDDVAVKAGLDGVTPHELWHMATSLAVSAGANVKSVPRMLRHASAALTLDVRGSIRRRPGRARGSDERGTCVLAVYSGRRAEKTRKPL